MKTAIKTTLKLNAPARFIPALRRRYESSRDAFNSLPGRKPAMPTADPIFAGVDRAETEIAERVWLLK